MTWTALAFLATSAALAGLKLGGFLALDWLAVAAPAAVFLGLWVMIILGTAIHTLIGWVTGTNDSRGSD